MSTVPEFLRHDLVVGAPATVVLRSGLQLHGSLESVDLVDDIVRIGGWAVRVEEIAGVRSGLIDVVGSVLTPAADAPTAPSPPGRAAASASSAGPRSSAA